MATEAYVDDDELKIKRTDGTTTFLTKTLRIEPAGEPITAAR